MLPGYYPNPKVGLEQKDESLDYSQYIRKDDLSETLRLWFYEPFQTSEECSTTPYVILSI